MVKAFSKATGSTRRAASSRWQAGAESTAGHTSPRRATCQAQASRRDTLATGLLTASSAAMCRPALAAEEAASSSEWLQEDSRRLLHSVMVVADLDEEQNFLKDVLGMRSLRARTLPNGAKQGFSGFLPEQAGFSLELSQPADPPTITQGSGFRHYAVAVPSIQAAIGNAQERKFQVLKGQTFEEGETYVRGPSGYLWELQELPVGELEPFREMSLIVSDITASLRYYCEVLGMRVVKSERTDDVSKASLCWGDEQSNTLISLTQVLSGPMAGQPVDRGSASYVQVACSTRDVYKTTEDIRSKGGAVTREPSPIGGLKTKVMKTEDPDGWTLAFVDNADFLRELCDAGTLQGDACKEPET